MAGDALRRNAFAPFAVCLAILGSGGIGLSVAYRSALHSFDQATTESLVAAATAAAMSQDVEGLTFVLGPSDAESIPARASKNALERITQGMPSVDFAGLYVMSGDGCVLLSSATSAKTPRFKPYTPVESMPPLVESTLVGKAPTSTLEPKTDSYGTWQEASYPLTDSQGEVTAVVLVQSSYAGYLARKAHLARTFGLAGGLVLLAGVGLSWPFYWLVRTPRRVQRKHKQRVFADVALAIVALWFLSAAIRPLTNHHTPSEVWNQLTRDASIRYSLAASAMAGFAVLLRRRLLVVGDRLETVERIGSTAEAQYRGIVESLPVGLAIFEGSTAIFINDVFSRQFGSGQPIRSSDQMVERLHPQHETEAKDLLGAISLAKHSRYDLKVDNGDLPDRTFEVQVVPIYEPSGLCRQTLVYSIDLTPELTARQAIQDANEELGQKNTMLSSALAGLEDNLQSVVHALVKAVEAKDPYTAGHSSRVMQYSLWLGEQIGLGPYALRILEQVTLVHDVGKIGLPDDIKTPPDLLTPEEYDVIKLHPVYGVEIIKNIAMFKECIPIVRSHHERLDGKGYPDGLQGDEISVLVRISSIADIFDAMTSTRAYRDGMPLEKVLAIMDDIAMKGEIDAELFAVFCSIIRQRGIIPQETLARSAA